MLGVIIDCINTPNLHSSCIHSLCRLTLQGILLKRQDLFFYLLALSSAMRLALADGILRGQKA